MRTLPAQFTDIATQLAGGQNPWLILLQQGGQVKDSFGGMIPMFRGLAGAITLPMVGVTSLVVATGALAYAWYQGDATLSEFNKTLVLSGNQAGLTADRMLTLSRAGQAAGLTFNQARESLAALVNAVCVVVNSLMPLTRVSRVLRLHPVWRWIKSLKPSGS